MSKEENDEKSIGKNIAGSFLSDKSLKLSSLDNSPFYLSKPVAVPSIMNSLIGVQKAMEPFNRFVAIAEQTNKANAFALSELSTIKSFEKVNQGALTWKVNNPVITAPNFLTALQSISTGFQTIANTNTSLFYPVNSELTKSSKLYSFANKSLLTVNPQNLGSKINLDRNNKDHLNSSFLSFSTSYAKLVKTPLANPIQHSELNSTISRIVPIEYFSTANLVEAISVEEKITIEEEVLKKDIIYENEISLNEYLPMLNADLYLMWQGAIQAYHSNNIDKIRHFATSIRELYTHVFQYLAPDAQVRAWSTNPNNFSQNRPTRKARLFYICRNINEDSFIDFLKKDIDATEAFINIFQRGTHKLKPNFSQGQLIAFKSKAESTLKFLLEIHFRTNI